MRRWLAPFGLWFLLEDCVFAFQFLLTVLWHVVLISRVLFLSCLPSVSSCGLVATPVGAQEGTIGSKLKGNYNVFSHHPKDPTCEVCKKTKTTRTRRRIEPKKFVDGNALSTKCGYLITANHKIQNVENESKCGLRNAVIVQDFTNLIQRYPMKNERNIRDNVVFTPFTVAGKDSKLVTIYNGIMTQAPAQKRTAWQKGSSAE